MSSRGALPYYTAAWVIGCFIFAAVAWAMDIRAGALVSAAQFLSIYFISLIVGAADSLLFAWLLRVIMRAFRTHSVWLWIPVGACLALLLTLALARVGEAWTASNVPIDGLLGLAFRAVLLAPTVLRRAGLWHLPIEGAATAGVLFLVNRAFDRPNEGETVQAKQSAV